MQFVFQITHFKRKRMSINEKLKKLYNEHFDKAQEAYKNQTGNFKMANPLLLKLREKDYEESDIKVIIYGQETYGWFDKTTTIEDKATLEKANWDFVSEYESTEATQEFGNISLEQLMYEYDKYLNHNIRKKQRRTFWNNGFDHFSKALNKSYPNKKLYFMWNNISKFGKINETGMTNEIRNFEREYFSVIAKELEILKPNIVIFLTGPDRDIDIIANFGNVTFNKVGENDYYFSDKKKMKYETPRQIVGSSLLPKKTIRLYHPNCFGGYNMFKKSASTISFFCDSSEILS